MHFDYNHPHTPTNTYNLYKIIYQPHTQTLLLVSVLQCHPQEGITYNILNQYIQFTYTLLKIMAAINIKTWILLTTGC